MSSEARRQLTRRVESLALALGFDRVGVARAEATPHAERFRDWLARGFAGDMDYLGAREEERCDPRRVLADARSVIVVALVYETGPGDAGEAPAPAGPQVARYARGDDYHDVLGDRLESLAAALEPLSGRNVSCRAYVDTGPVLERAWAARAGVGWVGKNGCVIDPELGSYLFLGVLLCDLELEPGAPLADHCGSCRACLDACPTDAFVAAGVLDATRCIAYTTIEDPGPVPEPLRAAHAAHLFGCDVCQEVCPWNRSRDRRTLPDPLGLRARLAPREVWQEPALAWVLALSEDAWRESTRGSALRRARYRGLLRNALVAAGGSGDTSLAPLVRRYAEGSDRLLADHAHWALERLGTPR